MTALPAEIYRQLIDEFANAWSSGKAPEITEYLQRGREQLHTETISSDFVLTLIELDLVQRIGRSAHRTVPSAHEPRVEDYAEYLGEYCGDRSIPFSLIAEEFRGKGNCEIVLDEHLASLHVYPAIDLGRTGTRREESLLDPRDLDRLRRLRVSLDAGTDSEDPKASLEALVEKIQATPSNRDLLDTL